MRLEGSEGGWGVPRPPSTDGGGPHRRWEVLWDSPVGFFGA